MMRIITYGKNNWNPDNLVPRLKNGSEWFVPQKDFYEINNIVKTMDANLGRPFIREILENALENQTKDKKSESEAERIFFVLGNEQFGWREEEDKDKEDLEELVRRKTKEANGNLRIYPICLAPNIDAACWGELARAGNGQVIHFPGEGFK